MALPQIDYVTEADYLVLEQESGEIKHEYIDGQVYAMTGASEHHNLIVMNVGASLHAQLRKRPCRVYPSDMRVRAAANYAYPDVSVLCGEPQFAEDVKPDTLLNPQVIIEVLSDSTEHYDRGAKFQHYRQLDALQEYVLITQDSPLIEHFRRNPDGTWTLTDAAGLDATVQLPTIDCTLALSDVYEKVTFADEADGG